MIYWFYHNCFSLYISTCASPFVGETQTELRIPEVPNMEQERCANLHVDGNMIYFVWLNAESDQFFIRQFRQEYQTVS